MPTLGSQHTASVEGARLFWALLSPVHERSGYRVFAPDRIQAVIPHCAFTAQSTIMSCRCHPDRPSRPPQFRAVLAAVKAWPGKAVLVAAPRDGQPSTRKAARRWARRFAPLPTLQAIPLDREPL